MVTSLPYSFARFERRELLQVCLRHYLNWLETVSPQSWQCFGRNRLDDLIQRTRELLELVVREPDSSLGTGNGPDALAFAPDFLSIASSACSTYLDSLAVLESFADSGLASSLGPPEEIIELSVLVGQVRGLEASLASLQTTFALRQ